MGQSFKVYVDYAHQKEKYGGTSYVLKKNDSPEGKVIVLLGGRRRKNTAKRPRVVVAKLADLVVVSNVDPYEDDPIEIAEGIARSAEAMGKYETKNYLLSSTEDLDTQMRSRSLKILF